MIPARAALYEGLQLAEAPAAHHAVEVRTPNASALTDAFQPFEPYCSVALPFSFINDCFAQYVVFVADAPKFIARETLERAFSTSGPLALKRRADAVALAFEFLPLCPVMQRPVAGSGGVTNAEIDTMGGPSTGSTGASSTTMLICQSRPLRTKVAAVGLWPRSASR